ncbi:hypothetical protein IKG12_02060 [Candidatus Saccharibacteria bacterium]|nr:hypothetical protein [Candidatus Saccharibacteria bacterium]
MTGASLGYDGYYGNASLDIIGIGGVWWSSIIRDANRAYFLSMNVDNGIYPSNYNSKSVGRSVRCASFDSITKICYNVSVVGVFLRRKLQMWCIHERGKLCLVIFYF